MDYDFSKFNIAIEALNKLNSIDFCKTLSPALQDFINNLEPYSKIIHSTSVLSATEIAKKFQIYYSELYKSTFTATQIAQSASKALSINIPYDYDSISGAVSAMASLTQSLSGSDTVTRAVDEIVSNVSSALDSLDKLTTSSEEISNDYIELSEPLADIVQKIDSSIELPKADENNVVRVSAINRDTLLNLLGVIIALIMAIYTIQSDKSNTELSIQQHNEVLEQGQRQHEENLRQDQQQHEEAMRELHHQTEFLEQIEQNTSTDADSQEFTTATTQSE